MPTQRKKTGVYGEQLAERYLIEQGYKIVAKNWRCPEGELDLVARQGENLVFVEVRTRRGTWLGTPEESITPAKQAKLIKLAYTFLADYEQPDCRRSSSEGPWRIDVIAIVLNKRGEVVRFNHLEAAVGE
jgi:putative endonuclease